MTPRHHGSQRHEHGFTLIEALVVIIVLGILAAVAVPAYLNQRNKASRAATKATMRNAVNEILLARESKNQPLGTVTGSWYSLGPCTTAPGFVRVADPAFPTSPCGQSWLNMTDKIATASGSSVATVRVMFTDGWGWPIMLDENEAETQWGSCSAITDGLISPGPSGINGAPDRVGMAVPLGGFCQ